MNLTDKEVNRFRVAVNSLLEELPKLVPHSDRELALNNRKYTYLYTQYPNELYVTVYCKGAPAYYFKVEELGNGYTLSGWSYYNNAPMTGSLFTVYVGKNSLQVNDSELSAIIKSISSKERFVNLYTALCLVSQNNTILEWKD